MQEYRVSDGAFYECIKNCHILYRLIENGEQHRKEATDRGVPPKSFEDILDRLCVYDEVSEPQRSCHYRAFLLEALCGESHFHGELSPQVKYLAYILRRLEELDEEILTSLDT